MSNALSLKELGIAIKQENESLKPLLNGVTFSVELGEVLYLLGPNGVGKSALLHTIMGSPFYEVTSGEIRFSIDEKQIILNDLMPNQRAQLGIYLSFQEPTPVAGVSTIDFLYNMYRIRHNKEITPEEFKVILQPYLEKLQLDLNFLNKELNMEYSGGEKKRLEVLTLLLFKPKLIMLDELDSGLDIDSERLLFGLIKEYLERYQSPIIIVSHNFRILDLLPPTKAVVLRRGKTPIVGDGELVKEIIANGYGR